METADTILTLFREAGGIEFIQIILILAGSWLLLMVDKRILTRIARSLPGTIRSLLLAAVPAIR